ncbi:FkbM family methyltransferase [Roseibium sp. Sym1]|uniref:FkbM family methyltransferase n=1 Tax=Roseibium sp. Sym1 TaxID=3016006 RepID=UPI0022B564AC|nr:FkbM family methyltransferase [Roseibium sp. Sym1]
MSISPSSDGWSVDDLKRQQSALAAALTRVFGPERGALRHDLWIVEKCLGLHAPFHSQSGQDRFVHEEFFTNRTGGTFVDIGGYDGVTGSNTLFFERSLGWNGLLVEPASLPFAIASRSRTCACRRVAAGDGTTTAAFIEVLSGYTQMSGLETSYDQEMLEVVRRHPEHSEQQVRVEVRTIGELLRDAGIERIDYVSLDVEGGERAVLEAFPFESVPVTAWSIENNTGNPDIARFMAGKGYAVTEFIGTDEIYCAASAWRRT